MLCMLCSTTTQTTFGIHQPLLVLEGLEIVSCANITRGIAWRDNFVILVSCSNTISNSRPLF